MSEPLLRFVTPADLPHVAKFLVALGGHRLIERLDQSTPYRYYRWKYFENPIGEAIVGMAVTDEYVVSTVAATPTDMQIGGRRCRAYVLSDFLTVSSFRRRGLFTRLLAMVCHEAAARGAELLVVQPNEESAPLLAKQGFQMPVEVREHWHPIPSTTIAAKLPLGRSLTGRLGVDTALRRWLLPEAPAPANVPVRRVMQAGAEIDAFWDRLRGNYRFLSVYDTAHLTWRFLRSPAPYRLFAAHHGEHIDGLAIVAHAPDSGQATLMSLLTPPGDEASTSALVHAVLDDARDAGLQRLYAWAVQGEARTPADEMIRKTCPVMMRTPVRVAVRILAEDLALPDWDWRIGPGDFDGL